MRALGITLALLGPAITFLLGAIATAFAILGSPFTINTPGGYLATGLAAQPAAWLACGAERLACPRDRSDTGDRGRVQ